MRGPSGKGTAQLAVHSLNISKESKEKNKMAKERKNNQLDEMFEEMKLKTMHRVRSWAIDNSYDSLATFIQPENPTATSILEKYSSCPFSFAVTFIYLDWKSILKDILLSFIQE